MTEVAFAPVLLAGIVSVLLGYLWYHPRVFGSVWMRLSGITPEQAERGKKRMWIMAIVGLLASMLVAYVMDYFGIAWGVYDVPSALNLGFWCWAGFAAPPMLGMVLWEQRSVRLYLIVAIYWLVAFIAMALVLFYASALFISGSPDQNTGGYITSE